MAGIDFCPKKGALPMQMTVYALQPEEEAFFEKYRRELNMDLVLTGEKPSLENVSLLAGSRAVNVVSDVEITQELWRAWQEMGIRAAVTRTIGREHMHEDIAAELGIPVFSITYSPCSVADYAIMMMLMVLRNIKPMLQRYAGGDFTASGILGRELPELTVGVLGAGRIGQTVIRHLSGFGCRVLYWNRTPRPELDHLAEAVDLGTLLGESDVLSLHMALCDGTHHFLNRDRIAAMKPGAVLINTARGPLVDTDALIDALESGHLSGAGLDVFDGDRSIYYRDFKNRPVPSRCKAVLDAMPNVLMLPHMAYFTDRAVEDMVAGSMLEIHNFFTQNPQQ